MYDVNRPFIAEVLASSLIQSAERARPKSCIVWAFSWNQRSWEAKLDRSLGLLIHAYDGNDFLCDYRFNDHLRRAKAWGLHIGPYYFERTLLKKEEFGYTPAKLWVESETITFRKSYFSTEIKE